MLNHLSQHQIETIALWYVVQHSLSSFNKVTQHFSTLKQALTLDQVQTWQQLGLHKNHIQRLIQFHTHQGQQDFKNLITQIQRDADFVITVSDPYYPTQLQPFSDKPPVLFGQGHLETLLQPQVAIVGGRKASTQSKQIAYDFAFYLSEKGFYINSGLAQGIDEAAHLGGLEHHRTIAVMGTGLDLTYPSQHQNLRQNIVAHGGAVITEFLPNTKPLQQNFPRRNRLVSGLSLGVIVAEANLKSGSLITAQLAIEQGKIVFAIPGHIYDEKHQGCHLLIREGAILVDHPEQVLEDLALPTQWQMQNSQHQQNQIQEKSAEEQIVDHTDLKIAAYLIPTYQQLDWSGQNIDQLAFKLQLDISTLTSYLIELELLGLCMQQSGLYVRCRSSQ